jgi:hypothetical protein
MKGIRGCIMRIVCGFSIGVHKECCSADTMLTGDLFLGNPLTPAWIITLHSSCKNRKMVKGNTAYIHKITTIESVHFILSLNTEYLSLWSLDAPGIYRISSLFYEKSKLKLRKIRTLNCRWMQACCATEVSWQQLCWGTRQKGRPADKKLQS